LSAALAGESNVKTPRCGVVSATLDRIVVAGVTEVVSLSVWAVRASIGIAIGSIERHRIEWIHQYSETSVDSKSGGEAELVSVHELDGERGWPYEECRVGSLQLE
jgi:hypothetical protein